MSRRTLYGALVMGALSVACADPSATVAPVSGRPSLALYDPSAPVPTLLSVERIATMADGSDSLRVTFTDTATDETLVSLYVTGCADFAATANIDGTVGTGERSADVVLAGGYCTARARYLWNPTPSVQDSWTWGAFSDPVAVTESAAVAITAKRKGKK